MLYTITFNIYIPFSIKNTEICCLRWLLAFVCHVTTESDNRYSTGLIRGTTGTLTCMWVPFRMWGSIVFVHFVLLSCARLATCICPLRQSSTFEGHSEHYSACDLALRWWWWGWERRAWKSFRSARWQNSICCSSACAIYICQFKSILYIYVI